MANFVENFHWSYNNGGEDGDNNNDNNGRRTR